MIGNIRTLTAAALAILAFAMTSSAAKAQSLTGNFTVSVTETKCGISGNIKCGNQSYCLELTDDGSSGRPQSGPAILESSGSTPLYGNFQVIGKTFMATFGVGSDTGEEDSVVLVAPANPSAGTIGIGIYDLAAGESEASGLATFGAKNGCSTR